MAQLNLAQWHCKAIMMGQAMLSSQKRAVGNQRKLTVSALDFMVVRCTSVLVSHATGKSPTSEATPARVQQTLANTLFDYAGGLIS